MSFSDGTTMLQTKALRFLLLSFIALAVLSGSAHATTCGNVPSSLSSYLTACMSVNIINPNSIPTNTGLSMQFSSTPFNAIAGNVIVYNSISGNFIGQCWGESNSMLWCNMGTNVIGAASSANGIYAFGFGSSGTNFFTAWTNTPANAIGIAGQLSGTYGIYDNGNSVFTGYTDFPGCSLPSGWSITGTATADGCNGIRLYGNGWGGLITSVTPNPQNTIVDSDMSIIQGGVAFDAFGGYGITSVDAENYGAGWDGQNLAGGGTSCILENYDGSWGHAVIKGGLCPITANNIYSAWASNTASFALMNYTTPVSTSAGFLATTALHLGITVGNAKTGDYSFTQWIRYRVPPPYDSMPIAVYGAVQSISYATLTATPNPYTLSNSSILVGQISIANTAISGGTQPLSSYTGNWAWVAPNTVTLSNTPVQTLPTTNNALSLTINAVSSNSLKLTFWTNSGGVVYYANAIGTNTIYGAWTFNGYVSDSNGDYNPSPQLTNTLIISSGAPTLIITTNPVNYGVIDAITATNSGNFQYFPYYMPVGLRNTQSVAYTANSQVMATVNALKYPWEATSSWNSTRWQFTNGTVIPSYMEGCLSNEAMQANLLYTCNSIVFWLRFPTANVLLPAGMGSPYYVYLVFAGNTPTASNNLVTGGATGMSAQLAYSLGEANTLDNGASVFGYYQNFANSVLMGSLPSGMFTRAGSVTLAFNPTNTQITNLYPSATDGNGIIGKALSLTENTPGNTLEIFAILPASSYFGIGASASQWTNTCHNSQFMITRQASNLLQGCYSGTGIFHLTNLYSPAPYSPALFGFSMVNTIVANYIYNYNYIGNVVNAVLWGQIPANVEILTSNVTNSITLFRIDTRANPPANTPATVTFGQVQSTLQLGYCQGSGTCTNPTPLAAGSGSVSNSVCGATPTITSCWAAGTYNIIANDVSTGISTSNVLTISQTAAVTSLASCSDEPYISGGYSCPTVGTIGTLGSQVTATLTRNGITIGTSASSLSDTVSNSIGNFAYVWSASATANYLAVSDSASYNGFVPVSLLNITPGGSTVSTKLLTPSISPFTWNTYYPIYISTTSPSNSITYTLTQGATTLQSNVLSIAYMPSANTATGSYSYLISEFQGGNSIAMTATATLNMVDMNGQLSFVGGCNPAIQYSPNCAQFPYASNVFTVNPVNTIIKSDVLGNQHKNSGSILPFSNANLTFNTVITLTYAAPFGSFTLNMPDNPSVQTSVTQTQFKFAMSLWSCSGQPSPCSTTSSDANFANAILIAPNAPYTREINNISGYDEQFRTPLFTNFTVTATYLFNNYTISNTTSATGNNVKLYMPLSGYSNPPITQVYPSVVGASATSASHYDAVNTYCPAAIPSGTYRNFPIYSVNANGSLYTFTAYSGYAPTPSGTFMEVIGGISNASAIYMQSFKLNSNPYSVPLQNGHSYAFKFFNCTQTVYQTNFSVWGNPITLYLPQNTVINKYLIPAPNATCTAQPYGPNTLQIVCNGSDGLDFTNAWKIKLYNVTTPLSSYLISNALLMGTGFTWDYAPISNKSQYQVIVVAEVGNVIDPQYTALSWFYTPPNLLLPEIAANGWIAVLMILSAIAIGSRSPAMCILFELVVLFMLPALNILPIPVSIVYSAIALGALGIFIVAKRYVYG